MALIKCNECGKDISDKALACPNCGFPLNTTIQIKQSGKEAKVVTTKKWYQTWKGLLLLLFVVGIFSNILSKNQSPQSSSSDTPTPLNQKAAGVNTEFSGKDNEAVEKVKRCKIPGTNGNVMALASGYLDTAKSMGSSIEFEGWAGFQVSGSLYEVDVAWKANGEKKRARWDVDFVAKTIKPKNQEASIFSGNNDSLNFL